MKTFRISLFLSCIALPIITQAGIATSFNTAKKNLYTKVYPNHGTTYYVGCDWSKKKVDLKSCNLQDAFPKKMNKRAKRVEAEHIIPASWMYKKNGKWRQCALDAKQKKESMRKYCQKHDQDYENAHNDLVNLRVAVGAINAERSNKPYSTANQLSGSGKHTYRGANGKSIILTSRVAVPDKSIQGDIARTAFYMRDTYGITYSKRQAEIFDQWNKADPVSKEEIALNNKIKSVQGSANPYVK